MDAMTSFDYPLPAGPHSRLTRGWHISTVPGIQSGSSRTRSCGKVSEHGCMRSIGGCIYVCVRESCISGRGRRSGGYTSCFMTGTDVPGWKTKLGCLDYEDSPGLKVYRGSSKRTTDERLRGGAEAVDKETEVAAAQTEWGIHQ